MGFQSGYHAGAVLAKATPCTRLAQAAGVRVRVKGLLDGAAQEKGETDHVYVQLDGEPWQQDVPSGEGEFVEVRCRPSAVALGFLCVVWRRVACVGGPNTLCDCRWSSRGWGSRRC